MKDFKLLTREDLPCWYELSWQAAPPTILLRLHRAILKNLDIIKSDSPMVNGPAESLKLPAFQADFNADIGYGGVFKNSGSVDDFMVYKVEIPPVQVETDESCHECGGSGKQKEWPEENCYSCHGSGKEDIFQWQTATQISATFTVLTEVLNLYLDGEMMTDSLHSQLFTLNTITQIDMHGGSLDGEFSPRMTNWLRSLGEVDLKGMIGPMKTAYDIMFGASKFLDLYHYRAWLRGGGLCVDIPGDACGIHPSHWDDLRGNSGYRFSCHNVDTSAQQLTLIAGLAALSDLARKSL